MSAVARRLEFITSKTGVREGEMAELLGTSAQTLHRWRKASVEPQRAHVQRIADLEYVAQDLAELYAPDEARFWLYSRNRLLDGQRPVDLISRGELDPVLQAIALVKDGAFA